MASCFSTVPGLPAEECKGKMHDGSHEGQWWDTEVDNCPQISVFTTQGKASFLEYFIL